MPAGHPEKINPTSLNDYLEIMSKSVFQSGMSWKVIENKWPGTKEAFHGFDVQTVADFNEKELEALSQDTRVVRNYRKLSAIISNVGRRNPEAFTCPGFKPEATWSIPPPNSLSPLFFGLQSMGDRVELMVTAENAFASQNRLEKLLDFIASGLEPKK